MTRNCLNCGAIIEPGISKCPFCGTSYFDLTSLDLTSDEPVYLKIRVPSRDGKSRIITQKCIPKLGEVKYEVEYGDFDCWDGSIIRRAVVNNNLLTKISFIGIADTDGSLYRLEVE